MKHRFFMVLLLLSTMVAFAKEGKVATDSLNIRIGPSVANPVVGSLKQGAKVTIVGQSGSWYQVNPQATIEGYVHNKFLKGSKLTQNANFRQDASIKAPTMGMLKSGLVLTVTGRKGEWTKVKVTNPKGLKLFVHADYVSVEPTIPIPKFARKCPFDGVKPNYGVLVYDVKRNKELWGQKANVAMPIASITKMMTLLLSLEKLAADPNVSMNTMVPISAEAAAEPPTKACLIPGQKIKLSELLSVMIIISCNDCAACAGEFVGGSKAGFARLANDKARALGMKDTRFFNANGLPGPTAAQDNVATPRDLIKLARALWKHKQAREWVKTPNIPLTTGVSKPTSFKGHTPLLGRYGVDGIKTGYTGRAGSCVVTHAENEAGEFIIVLLGCESGSARNVLLENILKWLVKK